jgi:flagellar biogenesis protein FliO
MFCSRIVVCCCLVALVAACESEVRAQEATAEPHVLFSFDRKQAAAPHGAPLPTEVNRPVEQSPPAPLPVQIQERPLHHDAAVVPATQISETVVEAPKDSRRLAPQSRKDLFPKTDAATGLGKLPFDIPHIDSVGTAGAGLALVVGLFLLCMTLMRRSGPSPTSPLPRDAVAVLGRVPLMPKQFAHLLQVGNKLVLVSISGDRTDTITEITEPEEVDRMLSLCMKGNKQSSSAEFQRMLQQMAKEPTRGFLGKEAASYSRTARG